MLYIYILELKSNKYYIGKTTNPEFRFENYFNVNESEWTILYKPIKLIELISDCDNFDEDKYTLKYMGMYGVNNVRGGSFCEIIFNEEKINIINKMINNSIDKDYKMDVDYEEYINKFNNLQDINNEIIELEKQYEYIKNLNNILHFIDKFWKKKINGFYNSINENTNKNDNLKRNNNINIQMQYKSIRNFIPDLQYNNNNNLDDIFENLCIFVNDAKDKKLSVDIFKNIKNDDIITNILNMFINEMNICRQFISILKSKFSDYIALTYIDFDIFEKINLFTNKVKLNKLCLFLLQIENEVKRICNNHQVEDNISFEFKINKKIEILTDKMIKLISKS